MLKVSLHHASPDEVSPKNVLGRLDIGYAKLDALAEYKTVMVKAGVGELSAVRIHEYPRWSASIWDLVARAICWSLYGVEELLPLGEVRKGAFVSDLTAIVQHWPDGREVGRATIGTAHVKMRKTRCNYTAIFEDDLTGRHESGVFRYAFAPLDHWDLLARAYALTFNGCQELPPRPPICAPISVETDDGPYVPIDALREPARTGFLRWVAKQRIKPVSLAIIDGPCVPEEQYARFLCKAV